MRFFHEPLESDVQHCHMLNKRMIRKGRAEDRHLPQRTPAILTASARKLHESYVMSRYRTYTFRRHDGKPAKIVSVMPSERSHADSILGRTHTISHPWEGAYEGPRSIEGIGKSRLFTWTTLILFLVAGKSLKGRSPEFDSALEWMSLYRTKHSLFPHHMNKNFAIACSIIKSNQHHLLPRPQ